MAIADLLWACPVCGRDRGLRHSRDRATCAGCGTRFRRTNGARIHAQTPGQGAVTRSAAEWVDRLPDPARLLGSHEPLRVARVHARFADRFRVVRAGGRYVNRIEIYGDPAAGRLELGLEWLRYLPQGSPPVQWPFARLRAMQASSRTLQVRGDPHPLASFGFLDDSSFLWERLLELALRRFYRRTGRGEIVELQPRITAR